MTSNRLEPCFRMYLGKSNWVNLSPKVTADLKAIYDQGVPTRYNLAPGLSIDILPHDVDCNSKTTELPNLMRADLCYEEDEERLTTTSSTTATERHEAAQQTLSRFIKSELEYQGIVDAFPPESAGQQRLPHVFDLSPHRHLGLVPTPPKTHKRTHPAGPKSVASDLTTDSDSKRKPTKKARRSHKSRPSSSPAPSFHSDDASSFTGTRKRTAVGGKRARQQLSTYHLRSHDQMRPTSPVVPYYQSSKPSDPPLSSFDDDGRGEFFPVVDFETSSSSNSTNDRHLWYPAPSTLLQQRHPPPTRQDPKNESTGWDLYEFHHHQQQQQQQQQQEDFDIYSSSAYSSSPQFQPPPPMMMTQLDLPTHRSSDRYYPEYQYSHMHSFFMPTETTPKPLLPSSTSPPSSPFSAHET